MKLNIQRLTLAIASVGMLTIYGCGGGGGSGFSVAPPATVATTADVGITVVDGPIKNATVCLDKNNNGICDAGEPTGKTDAFGKVTLKVDLADVGKYAVLAVVGTDATDSDTGAVPVPFTLKAPADKTAVVSPLTTLVQSIIDSTGVSSAVAAAQVQVQTGINVSLFDDFTKSTSADNQVAGTIARMLVVTTQQQSSLIGSAVGANAIDGAVITKADLDKIIRNKLLEILPALLTALANPAVLSASTPANKEAALLAQATSLVNSASTGLTNASVATLVAINNQTASTTQVVAEVPTAGGNLRLLNFTDSGNFTARIDVATLAQATPDTSGVTRSVQRRYSANSGNVAAWTTIGGSPNRQSDLHFNGSVWVGCALNYEDSNTVRDAKGNAGFNTCDNYETGTSNRASFDITGKTLLDVYNQINAAGYNNINISNSDSVLGSTPFPANSRVFYQAATTASTAVAYPVGSSNYLTQYSATVAAGGTASSQANGVGCNSSEFKTTNGADSTTLESLILANPGTPCVFPQARFFYPSTSTNTVTSPDLADEAWGNSTVAIGTIGNLPIGTAATAPTIAPDFYSGNTKLRIAFKGTGANAVTYYSCKERFNTGATRNCTVVGTGGYTIATRGDARIMTLSNPPLIANNLTFQRVFVERGGKIYSGYQNSLGTFNSARFNLTATNALFTKLGLPSVDVNTPLALTKTSYAGEYRLLPAGNPGAYVSLFINPNGTSSSTYTNPSGTTGPVEYPTITFTNLTTGTFTSLTSGSGATGSGTVNFLTGEITLSLNDPTSTPTNVSLAGMRR